MIRMTRWKKGEKVRIEKIIGVPSEYHNYIGEVGEVLKDFYGGAIVTFAPNKDVEKTFHDEEMVRTSELEEQVKSVIDGDKNE